MTSLRWSHRSVLTSLPFTRTTNNYLRTGYTEGIPELESKAEAAPAPQRPRTTGLRHMGKSSGWTLTAWVLPQSGTAPCQEVSPEPTGPPVGSECPQVTASIPAGWVALWEPLLWFCPIGIKGECVAPSLGMEKWEGLLVTSTQALKD